MSERIETTRLRLVPLDEASLRASLAGRRSHVASRVGAAVPDEWSPRASLLHRRLAQLEAEPEQLPWLLRAIVLRDERRVIGHAGFHGPPGAPELEAWCAGAAELGYAVFPGDRRRGYAGEAAGGLMRWARETHGLSRFVVSIAPDNTASRAVAARLGFEQVGSHLDPEDGPEDVFVLGRERSEAGGG